jgi:hypothetical protein
MLDGTIAAVAEVVGAFGWRVGCEEAADAGPELVPGPGGGLAQERLELGEQLLDRLQIRAVGRQVEERGAGRGDRLADAGDLVGREVVEHHDVAGRERRRQELLDIGANAVPVIGPSSTSGAITPLCLSPATKVVVRQWPCGTAATRRWSEAQRP